MGKVGLLDLCMHKLNPYRLFGHFVVVVVLAGRLVQDPLETRGYGLSAGRDGIWNGVRQPSGEISILTVGCTAGRRPTVCFEADRGSCITSIPAPFLLAPREDRVAADRDRLSGVGNGDSARSMTPPAGRTDKSRFMNTCLPNHSLGAECKRFFQDSRGGKPSTKSQQHSCVTQKSSGI